MLGCILVSKWEFFNDPNKRTFAKTSNEPDNGHVVGVRDVLDPRPAYPSPGG